MRNKRGQLFSLIFVFVTLFMCIISSVVIYSYQQKNAESSLISPLIVLQTRDDLDIFEMREKALIEKSLAGVDGEFEDNDFAGKFKDVFVEGVVGDEKMMKFIFSDLTWKEKLMSDSEFDKESFVRSVLYSKAEKDSSGMKIARSKIGKKISLNAKKSVEVNFPVDFLFEFEREYLVKFEDGKFEVNVA